MIKKQSGMMIVELLWCDWNGVELTKWMNKWVGQQIGGEFVGDSKVLVQ